MKNPECFAALNEIELTLWNTEGLLSIIGHVLEHLEGESEAATECSEKALCFAAVCRDYSKMLFAAFNGLQDAQKTISDLVDQAQDACIKSGKVV